MARLTLTQTAPGVFRATDPAAGIEAAKLPRDTPLRATIVRPRSLDQNGLMFAAFTLIAKILNDGPGRKDWDQDAVRKRLLILTGYADAYPMTNAMRKVYGLPADFPAMAFEAKSMNFDHMPQDEACRFFERAMGYVISQFGEWTHRHDLWPEVVAIGVKLGLQEAEA